MPKASILTSDAPGVQGSPGVSRKNIGAGTVSGLGGFSNRQGLQPMSDFGKVLRPFASGSDGGENFPDSWVEPEDLLSYIEGHKEDRDESLLEDERVLKELGTRNGIWRKRILETQPDLFKQIGAGQAPKYLWIACCDSRVAPENLIDAHPGEVFVHRNIGNLVVASDTNMRAALHFALEYLKIQHIIVCGHYECGAIKAASNMNDHQAPVETWLAHVRDVMRLHQGELDAIIDPYEKHKRLVELNTIEQCINLFKTGDVQRKRAATGGPGAVAYPRIHAMVFDPNDGILRKLEVDLKTYLAKYKNIYNLYDSEDKHTWASYHDPL